MNNASLVLFQRDLFVGLFSSCIFIFHVLSMHDASAIGYSTHGEYWNFENGGDARNQIYRSGIFNLLANKPHTYDFPPSISCWRILREGWLALTTRHAPKNNNENNFPFANFDIV